MGSIIEFTKEKKELNKIESKALFRNLKSKYIIQKIFNNLLKKKSLDIIKYNKNIKNRVNISIKDYKEYSEIYSQIEIKIKPVYNKYGQFININKESEIYDHREIVLSIRGRFFLKEPFPACLCKKSFFCIKCGWVGALTPTLGMARVVSPGLFAWGWGRAPTPRQSVN